MICCFILPPVVNDMMRALIALPFIFCYQELFTLSWSTNLLFYWIMIQKFDYNYILIDGEIQKVKLHKKIFIFI